MSNPTYYEAAGAHRISKGEPDCIGATASVLSENQSGRPAEEENREINPEIQAASGASRKLGEYRKPSRNERAIRCRTGYPDSKDP